MVGFWAENRILGGVILFDRRTAGSDAVYIHPDWNDVTYRICELHDSQKQRLIEFLLSEPDNCPVPLPIHPDENNIRRVDPEEPIAITGIYRQLWDRNPPPEYAGDDRNIDVYDPLNYPTKDDQHEARARWRSRYERY